MAVFPWDRSAGLQRPHPALPERLKRSPGTKAPLAWADGPGERGRKPKCDGPRMIFLSRMLAITRGHRALLAIAVAGSVIYTALSVLPALIIRQMLTVLSRPSPAGTLVLLGL